MPGAISIDRFAAQIPHGSWFVALGEAMGAAEASDLTAWLDGLSLGHLRLAGVAGWTEAERIANDRRWDKAWWDAEERERLALLESAAKALGEAALLEKLSAVTLAANDVMLGAAA